MTAARKIMQLAEPLTMRRGGVLEEVRIAYETWGKLNVARDNAIMIFTGLSPSAHAASSLDDSSPGWWEDMAGPGRPIDSNRFFIICVNSLGSVFGSTNPSPLWFHFFWQRPGLHSLRSVQACAPGRHS
jgi:homoserine O-acetyltransferase